MAVNENILKNAVSDVDTEEILKKILSLPKEKKQIVYWVMVGMALENEIPKK